MVKRRHRLKLGLLFLCFLFVILPLLLLIASRHKDPEHDSSSLATQLFEFTRTPNVSLACTRLLLLIISAPHERERRATIRDTWAHDLRLLSSRAARVFVVGARTRSEQLLLEAERLEHGDILTDERLGEGYNGLLWKVVSALYCASSQPWEQLRYIAKIDSDNFVHVDFLSRIASKVWEASGSIWMAGYEMGNRPPIRDVNSKWYVIAKDYPFHFYPPYLNGPHYIRTLEAARNVSGIETLLDIASGKALRLEDVYVTGIARSRAHIPIVAKNYFFRPHSPGMKALLEEASKRIYAAVHSLRTNVDITRLQELSDEPQVRLTYFTVLKKERLGK